MKKFLAMLLALTMVLSLAACGGNTTPASTEAPAAPEAPVADATEAAGPVVYVDPFADVAEDYDELSAAVYELVLGEFNSYYEEAMAETNVSKSRALK